MPLIYHEGYCLGDSGGSGTYQLIKDTVGWTGKNLLKNTAESGSYQGITYTVNSDKSITINGTNTDSAQHAVIVGIVTLDAGTYKVNGLKNNGGYTSFWINLYNLTDSSNIVDVKNADEDVTFTLSAPKQVRVFVYWAGNATVSNITIYPMIRKADIIDPTYEPYHESVETMYEEEIHGVNLLKNKTGTLSYQGVTFTTDSNGYITANGLATNYAFWNIEDCLDFSELRVGDEYILSGCPQGGSNSTYCIYIQTSADSYLMEYGQSAKFTYTGTNIIHIAVQIRKGYNANNVVFKPMLRKATIDDSTYRPYNPQAIQNQLNAQGVLGAKNLLENTASTTTVNGVTFTVNADKSVTVNGTATADATIKITPNSSLRSNLKEGISYILSGCPGGGSSSTYALQYSNNTNNVKYDTGSGVEFVDYDRGTYPNVSVYILIRSGVTASNLTFKPMIRLASDPDDTYQPYAMTNRELTEKKADIYTKGDTVQCGLSLVGHVTTGATKLELTLRGNFDSANISNVSVSTARVLIRGIKGYLKTDNGVELNSKLFNDYLKLDNVDIFPQYINLTISLISGGMFTNVDNNTLIDIQNMTLILS